MASTITLASFEFDDKRLLQSMERLQTVIFELNKKQKELTLQSKNQQLEANNLSKTNENLAKTGKTLSSEYQNNQKRLQELNAEQENPVQKTKNASNRATKP